MYFFKNLRMKYKLIGMFLLTGFLPVVVIGIWDSILAKKSLMNEAKNKLENVRELKKNQVSDYLTEQKKDINAIVETTEILRESAFARLEIDRNSKKNQIEKFFETVFIDVQTLAKSQDVLNLQKLLNEYHDKENIGPNEPYHISDMDFLSKYDQKSGFLNDNTTMKGYSDMFLICSDHGHVMYTAKREWILKPILVSVHIRIHLLQRYGEKS